MSHEAEASPQDEAGRAHLTPKGTQQALRVDASAREPQGLPRPRFPLPSAPGLKSALADSRGWGWPWPSSSGHQPPRLSRL